MNEIIKMAQGDTIPTRKLFTAVIDNVQQQMSVAGWVCHSVILNYPDRTPLTAERQITAVQTEAGNDYFLTVLTAAESNAMTVADPTKPEHYIWSRQVSNPGLGHFEEVDIDLIVRSAAITA